MWWKYIHTILIIVIFFPGFANAQSKPKRDISKDASVVAQQREQAKRKANQATVRKKQKNARIHRKYQKAESPQYASYLRVDQLSSLTKIVSSYSGNLTFNVNTDGKEWTVSYIPSWCRVTKFSNSFLIFYEANSSHDEREDWFKVKADGLEVRIDIKQLGKPLNINAYFNYASLQHNVYQNFGDYLSGLYLSINANVTIKGAKGQKCLVVAFVSDEHNTSVKANYGYSKYAITSSYDVYTTTEIIPNTDEEQRFNVNLYLPNNAMRLVKRKNKLHCSLAVYCVKTSKYISGANYTLHFRAKKQKGKITTKRQ